MQVVAEEAQGPKNSKKLAKLHGADGPQLQLKHKTRYPVGKPLDRSHL
jgi:hypothetical protein